jgi:hypothetical protein
MGDHSKGLFVLMLALMLTSVRAVEPKVAVFDFEWGVQDSITGVQKVSNLILNVNIVVRDVEAGKVVLAKRVAMRDNTDESWAAPLIGWPATIF